MNIKKWAIFNHNKNSESKKLAKLVDDENLQSSSIIESIGDGVIVFNDQYTIIQLNPSATKLTGWVKDDALGIDIHSVMKLSGTKGGQPLPDFDIYERTLKNKEHISETVVLTSRDEKQTIISLVVSPILLPSEEVVGGAAVLRDVTKEQEAEQARADFISTASHEMRTPVAAIEGYLALALNPQVSQIDTKARDFLEKAHQSTRQLGKLFQDLLTSSKAEDGRLVSHPEAVEMGAFIQQLSETFQIAAQSKHLIVEYTVADSSQNNEKADVIGKIIRPLYYVKVDPERLSEVVTNIYDNAVKYTQNGKITIGLGGDDKNVHLYIQDTGAGIPKDDIPHLFQKFYRVDNSSVRTIGGTGLGLYICKKIVELYNGQIWVESELGKGSVFHISLPRLTQQNAEALIRQKATEEEIKMPQSNVSL